MHFLKKYLLLLIILKNNPLICKGELKVRVRDTKVPGGFCLLGSGFGVDV